MVGMATYPMGVNRIRLDNTEQTPVITDRVWSFVMVGDLIYYINISDNNALYRIRTDGTGNTKLDGSMFYGSISVVGDWIFATKGAPGTTMPQPPMFHRVRIDGTNFQVLD
jgi:hypothetical protein